MGFFTYFWHYDNPPALFWDENYHLASATKYQKQIFFQEAHPPWGKLVIAAGDKLVDANAHVSNEFEQTDYVKTLPDGYSFMGMRFAPTLFAWINSALFFEIARGLTRSSLWGLALSSLYLFDNALIVHSRGVMLDSIQMFGILLTLLSFVQMYRRNQYTHSGIILMTLGFGWALWTKLNGLIIALLFPLLLLFPREQNFRQRFKKLMPYTAVSLAFFTIWSVFVWQLHFDSGKNLISNPSQSTWYHASPELTEIKSHPAQHSNRVHNFYIELRDYFKFMGIYQRGVPRLDLQKVGENGSPFYWWPFGARAINYRWQTNDSGKSHAYLYLQSNPLIWLVGMLAVLSTLLYFLGRLFKRGRHLLTPDQLHFVSVFSVLYGAYMLSMSQIDRVMYLYHYFIPLLFSLLLASVWIPVLYEKFLRPKLGMPLLAFSSVFFALIFAAYVFYFPLTYYLPLSCHEFKARALIDFWQLKGVNCP